MFSHRACRITYATRYIAVAVADAVMVFGCFLSRSLCPLPWFGSGRPYFLSRMLNVMSKEEVVA